MLGIIFFVSLALLPFLIILNMVLFLKYGATIGFSFLCLMGLYYYWLFKDKSKSTAKFPKINDNEKPSLLNWFFSFDTGKSNSLVKEHEQPKSASVRLAFLVLGILLLISVYIALYTNFLIQNNLYIYLIWVSLLISVAIYLLFIYLYLKVPDIYFRRTMMKLENKYRHVKPTLFIFNFLIIPLLIIPIITKGLPLIPHYFVGQYTQYPATISWKSSSFSSKHCRGRVELAEFPHMFNKTICGLKKEDWQTLKVGDKITLIGSHSQYGFFVSSYKLSR